MEDLVRQAGDPGSGLAARAEPNVPRSYVPTVARISGDDDEYDEDDADEGAANSTANSSRGSSSRRMLSGLGVGVGLRGRRALQQTVRDCPACGGGGVCRCISGDDNRKQVGLGGWLWG